MLPCQATAMGLRSPTLLGCVSDDQTRLYSELVFPATGEHRSISATESGGQFDSIGRYWMHAVVTCSEASSGQCDLYQNWRTGEKRLGGEAYATTDRDLNSSDLRAVKGAFMGAEQKVGRWRLRVKPSLYNDNLVLRRGGRTVARQSQVKGTPQLTRRAATWATRNTLYLRPLRGRRVFRKRFSAEGGVTIAQVGDSIVYAVQPDSDQVSPNENVTAVSIAYVRRHWAESK